MKEYKPHCEQTGTEQGDYRFTLELPGEKVLLVIGLNPSTANETNPDRTIRKVMGFAFAKENGYDGLVMLNLSARRATNKWELPEEPDETGHRRNLDEIAKIAQKYPKADVLVAYGNDIKIRTYLKSYFRDIHQVLSSPNPRRWLRIGDLTTAGHPRHPLYAAYWRGLQEFDITGYLNRLK